jgi:hypothetical protein
MLNNMLNYWVICLSLLGLTASFINPAESAQFVKIDE